jgi:hypothetical protein
MTTTVTIGAQSSLNPRLDLELVLNELVITMRNQLADRRNRTLYFTDTFAGDGSTKTFTLTQDLDSSGRHKVMNVKTLTVDGVEQRYIFDYVVGYALGDPILGKIMFWNAPRNGAVISAYYGAFYSHVFPESPRVDMTSNSYPRISVQMTSTTGKEMCIGGGVQKMELTPTFVVCDIYRKSVQDIINQIRNYFTVTANKKGFNSFSFIMSPRLSPLIPNGTDPNDVVYMQSIDYTIPAQFEFGG